MRAAAGAAVSARRVIALMVVRVNMIRVAVLVGQNDAGTRLKRRYRQPCPVLPESLGRRQDASEGYFSASNASRHFSNCSSFPPSTLGNSRFRRSSASTIAAATAKRVNHF